MTACRMRKLQNLYMNQQIDLYATNNQQQARLKMIHRTKRKTQRQINYQSTFLDKRKHPQNLAMKTCVPSEVHKRVVRCGSRNKVTQHTVTTIVCLLAATLTKAARTMNSAWKTQRVQISGNIAISALGHTVH